MRTKQPYSLFPRKIGKKKKIIWYYMAYDEDGQRHLHSTGCTTRTQALEEVARRYSTNSLIKGYSQQTPTSFGDYAES